MAETPKNPGDPESNNDYKVGYGKPPLETRFQPGQSGNPRGRPKGTKNLKADLADELCELIPIHEGGRSQKVTKQRGFVKSLFARALKGDARFAAQLISLMVRLLDTGEGAPDVEERLGNDEHEILKAFEDRVRRRSGDRTEQTETNEENEENES